MFATLKLLLPALIPSWRFFETIAPSPRIEFRLLKTQQDTNENWQEFRPRPAHLSFANMLKRMVWNPRWNESLFLVSCAERLVANPTQHSVDEISHRIRSELTSKNSPASYMQFRLIFILRQGSDLEQHTPYLSDIFPSTMDDQ
jgi:hypothetical protein